MKRVFMLFILVVIAMMPIAGCRQSINLSSDSSSAQPVKPLKQKEMLDDFEYMYEILKENYPFFEVNRRGNKVDWLGKKNDYINLIKASQNDEAFLLALTNILKELNNGHTHMVTSKQQYENFIRNEGQRGPWFEQLNNQKAKRRYSSIPQKEPSAAGNTTQSSNLRGNISTRILDGGKVAYLRANSFSHFYMEEDAKIIEPFFNEIKDYRAFIIDIRGNGGGSDVYWRNNFVSRLINEPVSYRFYYTFRGGNFAEKFIKHKLGVAYKDMEAIGHLDKKVLANSPPELEKDFTYYYEYKNTIAPKESIHFKGKIYLVVDRRVYSSAEMFAVFAKSTKFATVVGERTGGDGIGIGPILCVLPNSGYIFRFSQVMGLTADGICNDEFKTEPDIEVPAEIDSDILHDQAVRYILNLVK